MAKKTKKSARKSNGRKLIPIAQLACVVAICIASYGLFLVGKEVYTTFELKDKLAAAEKEFVIVADENERLTAQRDKLRDPDYVETYARGNYMLTKEGESIFYLPGSNED